MATVTNVQDARPWDGLNPLSSCRFCSYLENGIEDERWTIVAETEHLVAVPSVGPLVPGWLLVMPKEHVLSFGALDADTLAVLMADVHRIAAAWEDVFGPLTWLEHGPAEDHISAGCGIDHAHMHLVPTGQLDLLAAARGQLPNLVFHEVSGPEAAADPVTRGDSYLYLRTTDGCSWLATSRDIPSQAFRRVIACQQGRPDQYDWKAFPHLDALEIALKLARHLDLPA